MELAQITIARSFETVMVDDTCLFKMWKSEHIAFDLAKEQTHSERNLNNRRITKCIFQNHDSLNYLENDMFQKFVSN